MDPNWEISPAETADRIKAGEPVLLLDCRRADELTISTLPGAMHIPIEDLPKRIHELDDHEHKQIVVLCRTGVRSLQAAVYLRDEGFSTARSLYSGINGWARTIDQSLTIY